VIYLDSSVVLARVLSEPSAPSDTFWDLSLWSSRLLLYEVWNRVHARNLDVLRREDLRMLLGRVRLVELTRDALDRALEPLPRLPRTLDALHLSTMNFLRRGGQEITLASYDQRLLEAAAALGIGAAPL